MEDLGQWKASAWQLTTDSDINGVKASDFNKMALELIYLY
jgi:hypothetical protein